MFVIALTGGLGAGKSLAARYFRQRGAVVLDLDELAHELLRPGTSVHARIVEAFGAGVLDDEGIEIDRAKLARAAFASAATAARLNAVVHPQLQQEVASGLLDLRLLPDQPPVVVLEVPLLAEAPAFAELADTVLAISAPEDTRIMRAEEAGMSATDARARIALQASDAERAVLADRVIVNDSTRERFEDELSRFWYEVVEQGAP